jgi:riboflavin synthase
MFTGMVECIGEVGSLQRKESLMQMSLALPVDISDSKVGDSFCVQGACLTAVHLSGRGVKVEVSTETLQRTTLGNFTTGRRVNVERALRLSDPLGGHLVTGHVDGMGRLLQIKRHGPNVEMKFHADPRVARYLVEKGSICIDGVSLTLGVCDEETFWVHLIPHTMNHTTLRDLRDGDPVNLEADIIGKYVEKFLANRSQPKDGNKGLSREVLAKHGFPSS